MNTARVACLGFVFDPVAQRIVAKLAPPGFTLSFAEKPDATTPALVAESDFVLCVSPVTEPMIAAAPKLRLIQKWGIGVDKIDLAAAERHGVYVAITAGANASVIAEHTLLLILATLRRLPVADRSIRAGQWAPGDLRPHARQLAGKTVGIVGFGNIGRAVAHALQGLQTQIIYYDPRGPAPDHPAARHVPLAELLATSDVVTLHCPGGPANRHMLDRAALAAMKPGAILINAARGELVDETALVEALRSGHLLGAGLDTFATEPLPPDSPLRLLDNTVLTPHVAGGVLDHIEPMAAHAFRNMLSVLHGQPVPAADWIVVPERPRFPIREVTA
jgi:phosphoglycerate dehydrogenase-like enzyme